MEAGAAIAAAVGVFASVTWLLAISFFLGRYAAKVDAVAQAVDHLDGKFSEVFLKLDAISAAGPHRCIQERRLAALEARRDARDTRDTIT